MQAEHNYSDDVKKIVIKDKTYFIVGTAHISKKSSELVREVIENENQDNDHDYISSDFTGCMVLKNPISEKKPRNPNPRKMGR